ncbi:hypothetical protein LXL04_006686 [Taraxacum kok-saghyz]
MLSTVRIECGTSSFFRMSDFIKIPKDNSFGAPSTHKNREEFSLFLPVVWVLASINVYNAHLFPCFLPDSFNYNAVVSDTLTNKLQDLFFTRQKFIRVVAFISTRHVDGYDMQYNQNSIKADFTKYGVGDIEKAIPRK